MAAVAKISPYRKRDEGVALFIDWENLKISLQTVLQAEPDVNALLKAIDNYGQRGVSRAYADWQNYEHLHNDQTRLLMKSVETVQILGRNPDTHNPIKNSADVALAVEATRTCYHYPDLTTFVLVTGDGDLVHLVNELKRNRNRVIIVGVEGTISRLLRETADEVIYYERDIEPHLSKPNRQSDVVDVDTVLEGIKKTLRDNRGALKLSDIGRIMGSKGISLRSSNYGLSELSDILVKRGEIESFEQNGIPYLRLSRSSSSRSTTSSSNGKYRSSRSSSRQESNRNQQRQDNRKDNVAGNEAESTPDSISIDNSWQALSPEVQQQFLSAIYGLEQRSPFVTFNYLVEHLHQRLPSYKRDSLEAITNALIDESILNKQRTGSGREARTVLQLNAEHDAVDMTALQERLEAAAQTEEKAGSRDKQASDIASSETTETGHDLRQDNSQDNPETPAMSEATDESNNENDSSDDAMGDKALSEAKENQPETDKQEEAQVQASSHKTIQFAAPVPDNDIIQSRELPADAKELWAFLQQAQAEKWVLEVVPQLNEADELVVPLQGLTASLPAGQLEMTRVDDASLYANKPIDVHVLTLEQDEDEPKVVLSRRGVLARRMVEKEERLSRELYVGRDVTCRVIALNDYAAFVDLGGERGFIHASEISEPAPSRPDAVLAVGDVVVARVTLLDWARERVQLSIKQAQSVTMEAATTVSTQSASVDEEAEPMALQSAEETLSNQAETRVHQSSSTTIYLPESQQGDDVVQAVPEYISEQEDASRYATLHADMNEDDASKDASAGDDASTSKGKAQEGCTESKDASYAPVDDDVANDVVHDVSTQPSQAAKPSHAETERKSQRNRRPLRWTEVKEHYPEGCRVTGEVNNVVDFGAFLTLEDKHSALLHKSELQKLEQWREGNMLKDVLHVGDSVDVLVKRHDNKRKHLILELASSPELDGKEAADGDDVLDEDAATASTREGSSQEETHAIKAHEEEMPEEKTQEQPALEPAPLLEAAVEDIVADDAVVKAGVLDNAATLPQSKNPDGEESTSHASRMARGMKIRADLLAQPAKDAAQHRAGDLLFFDDNMQQEQRRSQRLLEAAGKGLNNADKAVSPQGIAQDFLVSEELVSEEKGVKEDALALQAIAHDGAEVNAETLVEIDVVQAEDKAQTLAETFISSTKEKDDETQSEASTDAPSDFSTLQNDDAINSEQAEDALASDYEAENELERQRTIIQHATDVISHQNATYIPLTQLYHQLEQEGIELNPATFKNALVRAHQGRKLRIVRHPENRTLYAGLGVHATDEISEILL